MRSLTLALLLALAAGSGCSEAAAGKRIFGRNLGSAGDMAVAAYSTHVLADSPSRYWKMDETTVTNGSTFADSSGNSGAATLVGGWVNTTTLVTGEPRAQDNTGSGSFSTATFTAQVFAGDFTFEAWVMAPTVPVDYQWGIFGNTGCTGDFWGNTGAVGLSFDGSTQAVTDPSALTANVRHHFMVTRSGTTLTLYKDGSSVATGSSSATMTFNTLGGTGCGTNKQIVLQHAALYTTALSSGRASDHWTAGQ